MITTPVTRRVLRVTLWGGASYGHADESFPVASLAQARDMWIDRRDSNGHRRCLDIAADGTESYVYCPCWGDPIDAGEWYAGYAWYVDPDDTDDPIHDYPDMVLRVGPRGGVRWERS